MNNRNFIKTLIVGVLAFMAGTPAFSQSSNSMTDLEKLNRVEINTTEGSFTVALYDDTPVHRDNFLKLAREGFYDGIAFHRVIKDFMIQAGNPSTRPNATADDVERGEELVAEIVYPQHFHKRGALAAARTGDQVNPERRSSPSQFYIVTGRTFSPEQLTQLEHKNQQGKMQQIFNGLAQQYKDSIMSMRKARNVEGLQRLQDELAAKTRAEAEAHPFAFTPEQREAYTTVGGSPHLDDAYTVYGEVVSGMDVVEKIEKTPTGPGDKPIDDIRILSMKVIPPGKK